MPTLRRFPLPTRFLPAACAAALGLGSLPAFAADSLAPTPAKPESAVKTDAPAPKPAEPPKAKEADQEKEKTPAEGWFEHDMKRPRPKVVTPAPAGEPVPPPSDAVVLFDGKDLAQWKRGGKKKGDDSDAALWTVRDGYFEIKAGTGSMHTREKFGDFQLHLEWATPAEVKGRGQGRGNSGLYIGGFPEIQVLDSYENDTYPDGQAAALYTKYPPLVNASRKPGEWQTYDVFVQRAALDPKGNVLIPSRLTVIHNGVLVQHGHDVGGRTKEGDIHLQDHGNPVRFRNVWLRKLDFAPHLKPARPEPPPAPVATSEAKAEAKPDLKPAPKAEAKAEPKP